MTAYKKDSQGNYVINGKKYEMLIGSRAQVAHGTAYKTTGGLTSKDIKKNKHGRYVSVALSSRAKKDNRLVKAGYKTKKGQFGAVKDGKNVGTRKARKGKKRGSRGKRGGSIVL